MASPRTRAALMWVSALCVLSLAGCYTRLTNPKEAIFYSNPDGKLKGSKSARVIRATAYNAYLRSKDYGGGPPYVLQPGTLISLEVYGHSIDKLVTIRPDGMVDLPLIGEVEAAGRTIQRMKEEISARYASFYVDPPQIILNTQVTENDPLVRAGEVSVINPTGEQGVLHLTGDEYLSEALASLDVLHPKSEWNEIAIIRRGLKERSERFLIVCDFEKLLVQGDLDQDIRLRSGDIVFVPYEKNTLLEEIWATFRVMAQITGDARTITDYIERVEGY